MSNVYWGILFAAILLGIVAEANPKTFLTRSGQFIARPDPVAAFLLALTLMLVAGFRYRVGVDYMGYYRWKVGSWSEVFQDIVRFQEGGFSFLAKLSRTIYDHGQTLLFVSAVITIGLYTWTIYKFSSSYLLSILLYLFLGHWQGSFNGVRQYLAAAILFAGHRLILDRKLWQYSIVVLAASLFHVSAIVMFFPYFLLNRKANIQQLVLLTVGAIVIRFSYGFVFSLIGSLKDKTMDVTDSYFINGVNVFRILTAFIPVMIYLVLCRKNDLSREQNFYVNALFFHAFSMFASMGSTYLGRVGIFTGAMVIIGYGYLFSLIEDVRSRNITFFFVLTVLLGYWLFSINAEGIGRFHWILNGL